MIAQRRFRFLALGMAELALSMGSAWAQSLATVSLPSTASSEEYSQVTCSSTDAGLNVDLLQIASDVRDQLTPVLKLGSTWRFPVHLRIVLADDPLADRIREERTAVVATGKSMTLEAAAPASDPDLKSFVQQQYVTALLWEKFFADTQTFDKQTKLTVVPVWLIEGLNEWISEDTGRRREMIVQRAATIHHAPTLNEITGWQEISDDRLLGLYQRAFCYYLVSSLIHHQEDRASFQQWLTATAEGNLHDASAYFPTEPVWQQELLDATARSHDIVYTWEESASALAEAQTIEVPGQSPADTKICTLDSVLKFPRDAQLDAILQKKIFDLTALELRVHPSWRPIFGLYRFGLAAIVNNHPAEAEIYLHEAGQRRAVEPEYHQKLTDYVNWFEVTKDYAGHSSHFDSYFSTAHAMESVQGDPERPNPIRANLIQMESQL